MFCQHGRFIFLMLLWVQKVDQNITAPRSDEYYGLLVGSNVRLAHMVRLRPDDFPQLHDWIFLAPFMNRLKSSLIKWHRSIDSQVFCATVRSVLSGNGTKYASHCFHELYRHVSVLYIQKKKRSGLCSFWWIFWTSVFRSGDSVDQNGCQRLEIDPLDSISQGRNVHSAWSYSPSKCAKHGGKIL